MNDHPTLPQLEPTLPMVPVAAAARHLIVVDLDGTLADYSKGWQGVEHIGEPIPGAQAFVAELAKLGDVVVWTGRVNRREGYTRDQLRNLVKAWLLKHGFPACDVWDSPEKPLAAVFVDDRAVSCAPFLALPGDERHVYDLAVLCARQILARTAKP